jgi:hypothetical protein
MELASVMTHRLHLFDPSFSRKCTHIRFTSKFLSIRCSAAETRARSMDDEWEGSARLSIVQETMQNPPQRMPEKPPTDIQSDESSKDSDESVVPSVQSETPKVTGKTRGEIFLERSKEMLEVHSERSSARAIKTMERRIRKTEKEEKASSVEDYPLWQMCFVKSRPHDPCSQRQWRLWEWQRVCFCRGTPVSAFTSAV